MEPSTGMNRLWTGTLAALVLSMAWASIGWAGQAKASWSQWRGPDGLGVSADRHLPEVWDANSPNIKWKTRIPGNGWSSPIVSDGKVFVTTAYHDDYGAAAHRMVKIAMALAVLVFFCAAIAHLVSLFTGKETQGAGRAMSLYALFNSTLAGFVSLAFLVLVVLIFVFPEQYDATVGTFLQQHFGYKDKDDIDHLFYVAKGVHVAVWLNTGAIALLGLGVSLHWIRAHSIWRPLGVVAFAVLSILFVVWTPADLWKYPLKLRLKLPWVLPGGVIALWYLLGYLAIGYRRQSGPEDSDQNGRQGKRIAALGSLNDVFIRWRHPNMFAPGSALSLLLFASLALIAATVFVPANLLLPELGYQRAVLGIDFTTGKVLWNTPVFIAPAERKHRDSSYATPTPATDGQHVVASFGAAVVGLDVDGRILWRFSDPNYTENARYGAASSVVIWRNRAIVLQEQEEKVKRKTWMAAFEVPTGRVIWNVSPPNLQWAYTTPLVYDDGAGVRLITSSHENVACFAIESGQLIWQCKIVLDQLVASMVRIGSVLYLGGGTWGPEKLIAMKLIGSGRQTTIREIWSASKDTPGCASPVAYNGMVFTVSDKGILCAYDAETGKLYWRHDLKGRHLASLLAGDGKIYAASTKGLVTVVAAEPTLRVVSQNPLEGECHASPAVHDSHLLIRTDEFLYCIGE